MSLAHPDAFATENALVGIIGEERMAGIYRQTTRYAPQSLQLELEPLMGGNPLQFALLVLGAMGAVEMVMREKEFKGSAAKLLHFCRVRVNYHSVFHRLAAGCYRCPPAFDLNEAEPAAAKWQVRLAHGAQVWDVDVAFQRHPQQPFAFAGLHFSTIYGQNNFFGYGPLHTDASWFRLSAPASWDIMAAASARVSPFYHHRLPFSKKVHEAQEGEMGKW
jgi:hypothetical protein